MFTGNHMNLDKIKKLDISSLEDALQQLQEGHKLAKNAFAENNDTYFRHFRAASIQEFEFSFELSVKMMKKFCELEILENNELNFESYRDVIRSATEIGILESPKNWFDYRKMRNTTSHTYNKSKAQIIFDELEGFIKDVEILILNINNYYKKNYAS
jgi:nucleotidyltransferase substrate binding protein (TIGR01987 family)